MNARSQHITPVALEVAVLAETQRREMFALFERYYEGTSYARFASDLADKSRVLTLRDEGGALCGFSTLAVYERVFAGERLRVLFSGDTVVDERHWGQQALAFAWLRLAGEIKSERPHLPLYWFLISKGHRTYRYLSAFSREFHPAPGRATPPYAARLMAFLARDRFGGAYDESAGVLRFAQSLGHLRASYASVPPTHLRLPEVAFFLERNPGYARGEELVCLCELSSHNLRPMARRAFHA
ncbi:MAG TPA: hypothetical protein VEQ87_05155 [Burkholderiales bacterium]|nr:hypothetical protein [Burkholderiales bacterium]